MRDKLTQGIHHIGLTVPDLDQARTFFCGLLGFDEVGGVPAYPSIFVSDGTILLTLWRAASPSTARAFDRRANIGLHHLSLAVADDAALEQAWDKIQRASRGHDRRPTRTYSLRINDSPFSGLHSRGHQARVRDAIFVTSLFGR